MTTLRDGLHVPDEATPPTYCVRPLVKLKRSQSILFLSFGSMGVFSTRQLKEMAIGLERSKVRFLWVVRVPSPHDEVRQVLAKVEPGVESFLPEGFVDRTRRLNKAYLVEEMKLALSVTELEEDGLISTDELEEQVNKLMRSEKGRAIRDRVLAMRDAQLPR
ncbi:hypothetical protein NL676_016525 [Syzygium grande]|nr:hypothetical protein NL676_016525 [Syzygium grande]